MHTWLSFCVGLLLWGVVGICSAQTPVFAKATKLGGGATVNADVMMAAVRRMPSSMQLSSTKSTAAQVPLGVLKQAQINQRDFFLSLAVPFMSAFSLVSMIGNSISVANKRAMFFWGIANLLLNGMSLTLGMISGVLLDVSSSFATRGAAIMVTLGINLPAIAFSTFTFLADFGAKIAGWVGLIAGAATAILSILLPALYVGATAAIFILPASLGITAMGLGIDALRFPYRYKSRGPERFSVLPWFRPEQDGGLAGGVALSGRF